MRPEQYYIIYIWMIKELGLNGAQLLILAYLYDVHKHDKQKYRTVKQIAEATGYTPRQITNAINKLFQKKYLFRKAPVIVTNRRPYYAFNTQAVFSEAFNY